MAKMKPNKAVLQSAAADSYSKAGAEMAQAEAPVAKPNSGLVKPAKVGRAHGKGQKPR